jgi:hypothetical protein
MTPMIRALTAVTITALALPIAAHAQPAPRAGVVTTLQGSATVARASAPQGTPLKFKDDVFLRDNITAGDKSLARILLGGKAIVTVREKSTVTITEVPGTAIVEMSRGAIAVAVARNRLQPGESVQVRTPNAIAGIRGTVLIAEVTQDSPQADPVSAFTLLRGLSDIQQIDRQGQPVGSAFPLGVLQRVSLAGLRPPAPPQTLSPGAAQALAADFQVQIKEAPPAVNAGLVNAQVSETQALPLPTLPPPAPNQTPGTKPPSVIVVPPDKLISNATAQQPTGCRTVPGGSGCLPDAASTARRARR